MTVISPESLRTQRKTPAVMKGELASIREIDPCALVIVLEGKEDLPVYETWIAKLFDDLNWEPILANGKRNVLEFRALLNRDLTGLSGCTYFIVDSDYDGLRGAKLGEDIYVLPAYSVENYLTDPRVFESVLRTDFHIVGDVGLRARLVDMYERLRQQFFDLVRPSCEILRAAKNSSVGNVVIEENLAAFFDVGVNSVSCKPAAELSDLVRTEVPVAKDALDRAREWLGQRVDALWVRGKFSFFFMKKICHALFDDQRSSAPAMFPEPYQGATFGQGSLDFRALAARSPIPDDLRQVIAQWRDRCKEYCDESRSAGAAR